MTTLTCDLDHAKTEAFTEKVMHMLNGGALSLMISLGYRAGLFEAMTGLPPSTSAEIAEATGLNERYVREWLGAMVTGGIVEYEPTTAAYALPPEHAVSLTPAGGADNLAKTIQFLPSLGAVEDGILESFRNGGGVPYSEFKRFHEIMEEESADTVCASLLDVTLPMVPGIVERLERGITVLDIGCGRGRAVRLMAERFPASTFVGYDFSEEAIAHATEQARREGLTNVTFAVKDAATLNEPGTYQFITAFDAIHDQAYPRTVLAAIRDSLADDGLFLMQDIAAATHVHDNRDHPLGPFLYTISCMHCMTVSLACGGEGLGTVWGKEQALELLDEAGFRRVRIEQVDGDIMNYWYIAAK